MTRKLMFLTKNNSGGANEDYYYREITYEDNKVIEWEDNWGVNGTHYKLINNKWVCLKIYEPKIVNPRRRKSNTWDR